MIQRDRSVLLLMVGALAAWLGGTDVALNYVRPGTRPLLLTGGLVLCCLAVLPPKGLLAAIRRGASRDAPAPNDPGHTHVDLSIGWLLLVPTVLLIVVPPSPLGPNAVRSRLVRTASGPVSDPPIGHPVGGAVPMAMVEFYSRAAVGDAQLLYDVPVRVVGFVSSVEGGGYRLARFAIFCCAADAEAVEITVQGDAVPRHANEWLQVEGVFSAPAPGASRTPPTLRARKVSAVGQPRAPYEYTNLWSN
jgi:uncharacterized repeat protein (TIGR03943 family)